MNDLQRQNSRPQQTVERWTPRTHEWPSELARQSEAKRKQAPQIKARQLCVDDDDNECNLEKISLINCIGPPIMHRTPNTNYALRSRTSNAIMSLSIRARFRKLAKPRGINNFVNDTKLSSPILDIFHSWLYVLFSWFSPTENNF